MKKIKQINKQLLEEKRNVVYDLIDEKSQNKKELLFTKNDIEALKIHLDKQIYKKKTRI